MSTLSTNLYGSSINKGMGGLISGLDTDDIVKQMTAATKNKINRQYQAKQKLLYRQEAYREISTKLLSFSNKYFSYSSGSINNILSPKFFESYTYKSSSNYVNVTGNAENIKNFSINKIFSVATAASFNSSKRVSHDTIESKELTDFTSTIAGGTMTIEYEGKSYNLSIDKGFGNINEGQITLNDVASQLNEKLGGFIELSSLSATVSDDGKVISISSSVEGKEVKLTAASNSILDSLKFEVGKPVTSTSEIVTGDLTKDTVNILANENSYITFEYNGVAKKINLNETINISNIAEYLQKELNKAFGEGKITVAESNKLSFTVNNGDTNIFGVSSISGDLGNFIDIESGDYNRLNRNKPLAESGLVGINEVDTINKDGKEFYRLSINEVDIDFETTMSVTEVINKINSNAEAGVRVYYSSTTDTFMVKAVETGSHKGVSIAAGDKTLAQALFGSGIDIKGTDTEMTYKFNGVENTVIRSTANFTIDEINIELNEKASAIDFTNAVTFDVTNNSDEVVDRVKQFINDYNDIIDLISTKTGEKPNRNYLPLTPDQQDEMKEDEIKNWMEEAKKGVLYGDSKMNTLLRNLREAMSGFTDVSSLTLSSLGISAASMDTSGKLILDEKKFKEKLLDNPDEIAKLFTNTSSNIGKDAKSGISIQLQSILRENVGTYGTTGLLIDEAGMANSMTSDKNYISEKIRQHDDKMVELKKFLEKERQRYWNQFSALEQSLNKLNAQSSWLTDMMGGN